MALELICHACDVRLQAKTEDELANLGIQHALRAHGHAPLREHVLVRIGHTATGDCGPWTRASWRPVGGHSDRRRAPSRRWVIVTGLVSVYAPMTTIVLRRSARGTA